MVRLTERDEYGNADIIGVDSNELQDGFDFDSFNLVTEALNKLAKLEDLEEILPEIVDSLKDEADKTMAFYDSPRELSYGHGFEDGLKRAILCLKVTLGIKIT